MTLTRIHRRFVTTAPAALLACLFIVLSPATAPAAAGEHEPVVDELPVLLERRTDLDEAMTAAIDAAGVQGIDDVNSLAAYLDDIVIVFQDNGVVIDAELGRKYLQGQRIG
jgi:hypothetical protein